MKGKVRLKSYFTKKKLIALIVLISMIIQMFSPYGALTKKSFATVNPATDKMVSIIASEPYTASGGNKVIKVTYAITGENIVSIDFNLGFDKTKIAPAKMNTGAAFTTATIGTNNQSCVEWGDLTEGLGYDKDTRRLNLSDGTIRIAISEPTGSVQSLADNGYDAASVDDAHGHDYYMTAFTVYFYLVDTSITELTEDILYFKPVNAGMPSGFKYIYNNGSANQTCVDPSVVSYDGGFAVATKEIDHLTVKTPPTNTTYNHGDTVSLAGGVIEVTFDDGTTEDVSMTETAVKIKTGNPADVTDPKVGLEYHGKTLDVPLTVNDPVDSLVVSTPMNDIDYNHGENFDFTGLTLTANKRSGATIPLTPTSTGVTVSELVADINSPNFTKTSGTSSVETKGNQKITFTYEGKTADASVIVNDVITGIDLVSQPTKQIYKRGEALNLAGAVVEVTLQSGDTTRINLPNGTVTVGSYNPNNYTAKQSLSVRINTFTSPTNIEVEAYNYITGDTLTPPTKDVYEYGEPLALGGGSFRFTWHAGTGSPITVNLTAPTVSITGYSATTIGPQTLTATYSAKYTLSDGTVINDSISDTFNVEVTNPITNISITPPTKTAYKHGDSLSLAGGQIEVTYKNGTKNYPTLTAAMITEQDGSAVTLSPAVSAYTPNNPISKVLKITYTEDGETQTAMYPITLENNINTIGMSQNPDKTTYNLGETTYDLTNGEIIVSYAAGNSEVVPLTDSDVSLTPLNTLTGTTGTKSVQVSYKGKTTAFNITVQNGVVGITITPPTDVVFNHGDTLTFGGGDIDVEYADGTHSHPAITSALVKDSVTGLAVNMSPAAGDYNASTHELTRNLEITYTESATTQTASYSITLKNPVDTIAISSNPVSTYNLNDTPTYPDGAITATRKAGDTENVNIVASMVTGLNTAVAGTGKTATITYEGKTTTYTYNVINNVASIAITAPTTTTYNHGDPINFTGADIDVTYADGTHSHPTMTTAMITEASGSPLNMSPASTAYNSSYELNKTLTITYTENGVTQTAPYSITLKNIVTGIAMGTNPVNTTYNINDATYKLAGGDIIVTRAAGNNHTVALTDPAISLPAINTITNTAGTKPVTVTYEGKTTSFNVTVTNAVATITVTPPTDVTFEHGDALTFTGGDIYITYLDGTDRHETITTAMVTEAGSPVNMSPTATDYNPTTHEIVKALTITYSEDTKTGTANYNITLKNPVDTLAITTNPKSSYNLNDTPTYPDGKITVTRKAGDTEIVDIDATMVTGLDTTTAGTAKTATVTYETKTATYNYDVIDNVVAIAITAPTKTNYNHGQSLDLTGADIEVTYAGGSTSHPSITKATITEAGGAPLNMSPAVSDYDSNNEVAKTLTITYTENGVTKTEPYNIVIKNNVTGITMGTNPTDTNYAMNDTTYKLAGGDIIATRAAGNTETVALTDPGISLSPISTITNTTGTKPVTVTYEGETTTFNVTVQNGVKTITITPPTDITFNHGDTLTFNGGDIYVTYYDGTDKHEPITTAYVTEAGNPVNMSPAATDYNASHEIVKALTITYAEDTETETVNYNITLKNPIDSITIDTPPTSSYNLNDPTTGVGGTFIVTRKAGDTDPAPIAIADSMVTGLDTTTAGAGKTATVSYTEDGVTVTTTYNYDVLDNVTGITIVPPTKTIYNHGEGLDVTGGLITVTYAGGSTSNPTLQANMIRETDGSAVVIGPVYSAYTNNQLSKTLVISYTENGVTGTVNYPITIINNVTGITMGTNPTKTTYNVNDSTYDLTGGDIVVARAVGPTEVVALTDPGITLTPLATLTTTAGTAIPVTVTYEGQTTTFDIDVEDAVLSIAIAGTPKTAYEIGDAIDPTLSIEVTRSSGTSTIPVTSSMISGFDTTSEGSKTAVITYQGQTANYNYNVEDSIVSIAMDTTPKTNYLVGETLDVTGGTIIVTKKSGATDTVTIAPTMVTGFNSSSVVTGQTLTVTYNGLTTTYQVNITNPVNSITLNPGPTKTTYKYGESLDLTGASLDVVFENGTTDTMPVTSSMISGYNPNTLGPQTVTVTYGKNSAGTDVTTTFTVNVNDYVSSIAVTGEKTTYNYGDPLDLTQGILTINMASGTPATAKGLDDTDVTVTGYSATTVGNQTLTVTYGTETTTFNVEVEDYVTSTNIVVPTKTTYNYGDSLDLSTGKIVETMASGATNDIALTTAMVTEADGTPVNMTPSSFDSTNKANKTLLITYGGNTANYPITIVNDITSIVIKQQPKTDYKYGDTQDTSIGSIEVTRGNGVKEEIPLSDPRITFQGFDTTTPGTNIPVTVKFTENGETKQTTYSIDVNDNITSIQLVGTPKTTYKYGENLDLSGLTLTVVRPSGTTPNVPVTANMVSGYNPTNLGTQTVTITYGDKGVQYNVEVVDYLKDIELVKPTKLTYKKGEALNLAGASITEVMASGTKVTGIAITPDMVSSVNTSTVGTKTVTVTYPKEGKTFTKQFAIVVGDELSGISVKDFPVDEYNYGEGLDLTGATIEVELESGETQIVPITKAMVSGYNTKPAKEKFDDSDEYIQVITIKYTKDGKTQTTTYPITTKDYLDKIVVENLQDEYNYGEKLNVKDATVAKVMASGAKKDKVQLTNDMVSGYNPKKEGSQTLTISYAGKTAQEIVTVTDKVIAISINKTPNKTVYDYNTALNLTGAKLNVIKYSGTTVIDITNSMVSGYDPTEEGTQTITVTYAGYNAEFSVKVKAKPQQTTPQTNPNPQPATQTQTQTQTIIKYITVPQQQVPQQIVPQQQVPQKEEPKQEEPKKEEPKTETPKNTKNETKKPSNTTPSKEEKPTQTLGVKDENKNTKDNELDLRRLIAIIIALLGLIALIILLILANRPNVKVFVIEENNEFVLGGLDRISKKNPKLDIDKFLDEQTYPNQVKVWLNDSISEQLDGIELEITHRGQIIKHKVEYNDKPYEFILEGITKVENISQG